MKQLNTLLQQGKARLAGPPEDYGRGDGGDSPGARQAGRDHVDAINQMFAEFELAYHNQFHKAYAREGSLAVAKKYWLSCLQRFSPQLILRATRQVVSTQEFLPSLSVLMQACENAGSLFGLPEAHQAYVEACQAAEPKSRHPWSHPAVYHAGRATGWYNLATLPEARIFSRFEHHYAQLCQRVLNGEDLDLPLAPPLEESPGRRLSNDENRERLKKLRDSLKL